jgi:hypothetical protein
MQATGATTEAAVNLCGDDMDTRTVDEEVRLFSFELLRLGFVRVDWL